MTREVREHAHGVWLEAFVGTSELMRKLASPGLVNRRLLLADSGEYRKPRIFVWVHFDKLDVLRLCWQPVPTPFQAAREYLGGEFGDFWYWPRGGGDHWKQRRCLDAEATAEVVTLYGTMRPLASREGTPFVTWLKGDFGAELRSALKTVVKTLESSVDVYVLDWLQVLPNGDLAAEAAEERALQFAAMEVEEALSEVQALDAHGSRLLAEAEISLEELLEHARGAEESHTYLTVYLQEQDMWKRNLTPMNASLLSRYAYRRVRLIATLEKAQALESGLKEALTAAPVWERLADILFQDSAFSIESQEE